MARYAIPEGGRSTYEQLAKLSKVELDELLAALDGVEPDYFPPRLAQKVGRVLAGGVSSVVGIVELAASVEYLRQSDGTTRSDVAGELSADDALSLSAAQRARLAKRIEALLAHPTIRMSVRAAELGRFGDQAFVAATAAVSARPVFDAVGTHDVSEGPGAVLVLFELRLQYHKDRGDEQLVLSLDKDDIEKLRAELDRIEAEGDAFKAFLGSVGLRSVATGEER